MSMSSGTGSGKRVLLGRIGAAHGIRGEVQITSYTGSPEAIGTYGPLSDEQGRRSFDVRVVRVTPKGIIARIGGISDRTAAETLRGTDLYVARERLPPPQEGEFYHEDLIGLAAIAPDGAVIGTVLSVQNFGAGDLIEIRVIGQRNTELVPFKDEFVPTVDIDAGRITVVMPVSTPDEPGDDNAPPDAD
jgi:16S rRNA processing protein RimM